MACVRTTYDDIDTNTIKSSARQFKDQLQFILFKMKCSTRAYDYNQMHNPDWERRCVKSICVCCA